MGRGRKLLTSGIMILGISIEILTIMVVSAIAVPLIVCDQGKASTPHGYIFEIR